MTEAAVLISESAAPIAVDEAWKPIPGFEGYEASTLGRIRSWRRINRNAKRPVSARILKLHVERDGYQTACLYADGKQSTERIHSLVLLAFVGPCPSGMQCRHFPDRDRGNNALANLSWGTPLENMADRDAHGTTVRGRAMSLVVQRVLEKGRAVGSRTKPETVLRGDRHWSRSKPERVPMGSRHGSAFLTEKDIPMVLAHLSAKMTLTDAAALFGVARSTIKRISDGSGWKRVNRPPDSKHGLAERIEFVRGLLAKEQETQFTASIDE